MFKNYPIILTSFLVLVFCSAPGFALADSSPFRDDKSRYEIPKNNKISSRLFREMKRLKKIEGERGSLRNLPNALAKQLPFGKLDPQGRLHVVLKLSDLSGSTLGNLSEASFELELMDGKQGKVQGWVFPDRVEEISGIAAVEKIGIPDYAVTRTGSVPSKGDEILRALEFRSTFGEDGTGVRVGVISDGVDNRAAAQASGDLPGTITIVLDNWGGDEGTAMLEIIHDLAPGADLGFCGPSTSLDMVQCINDLADPLGFGADIIVDDLGFFGEAYFEDGPIAQAAADAVAQGVVYVSAAGNSGETHYEDHFLPSSLMSPPAIEHNFGLASGGPSDPSMDITVWPGEQIFVVLQWNDPFGGSGNDYDLFLWNEAESAVLDSSEYLQNGNDDPIEFVSYTNNSGAQVILKVQVVQYNGAPRRIELFLLGYGWINQYFISEGGVFGHPAVPGVLGVGAINADEPGNDSIAFYSSWGPSDIYFPAFESRLKPDLIGIDGVTVTGAGGFPSPFYGTSAAAPHVAALAALLKERFPGATAGQIRGALLCGSVDLGTAGPDLVYGSGRADAMGAEAFLTAGNPCIITTTTTSTTSTTSTTAVTTSTTSTTTLVSPPPVPSSDDGDSGPCFIATAAFGSALAPEVRFLREFRDKHLLPHDLGRGFVRFYYKISPPIADRIRGSETLKSMVRLGLYPVILELKFPRGMAAAHFLLSLSLGLLWVRRERSVPVPRA